jgi:hypothetical protein
VAKLVSIRAIAWSSRRSRGVFFEIVVGRHGEAAGETQRERLLDGPHGAPEGHHHRPQAAPVLWHPARGASLPPSPSVLTLPIDGGHAGALLLQRAPAKPLEQDLRGRLQGPLRARLVNDSGQMLCHELQGRIHRKTKVASKLLNLLIAESSPELVRTHWQVLAVAKPRLDLVVETALLKLGNKSLEVADIGLRQGGRNRSLRLARQHPSARWR